MKTMLEKRNKDFRGFLLPFLRLKRARVLRTVPYSLTDCCHVIVMLFLFSFSTNA